MPTLISPPGSKYSTLPTWRIDKIPTASKKESSRRRARSRSWTGAEEEYLLQCRAERLPYKRIAAKLQKSELACRLHYHQVTVVRLRPSPNLLPYDDEEWNGPSHTLKASSEPLSPRASVLLSPPASTAVQALQNTSLTLPGVDALLDGVHHRRSISWPNGTHLSERMPHASGLNQRYRHCWSSSPPNIERRRLPGVPKDYDSENKIPDQLIESTHGRLQYALNGMNNYDKGINSHDSRNAYVCSSMSTHNSTSALENNTPMTSTLPRNSNKPPMINVSPSVSVKCSVGALLNETNV